MTWLTWRLHRAEAAIGVLLFVGLLATMYLAIQNVDAAYEAARQEGCFERGESILCSERLTDYYARASDWRNLTTLLHGVPLAAAALLAIPTLQELERGTHRLAWTQSISRRRWTLTRIGFVAGVAALVAAVWAVRAAGWRATILRHEEPHFGRNAFELWPAVLIGYGLFAVALALAAAVVVRRLIPVLALLIVGFIGTRVVTTFVLRERYRDPIEETVAGAGDPGPYTTDERRWVVDESWLTRTGERISWEEVNRLCASSADAQNPETAYPQCLTDNGLQYYRAYHPTDRFDQFQAIETAIYLGLAAALLAFAYWWLTRRPA